MMNALSQKSLSRRGFLGAAGASAAVFAPRAVKGLTGPEIDARAAGREAAEFGISMWDLDTPSLLVDLDALEANIAAMARTTRENGIVPRPHAKTHKCPAIARMQLDAGAVGISVAKVSEAQVLFDHGIDRLLLTTSNVTPFKIRRAMGLRKQCSGFHPGDRYGRECARPLGGGGCRRDHGRGGGGRGPGRTPDRNHPW